MRALCPCGTESDLLLPASWPLCLPCAALPARLPFATSSACLARFVCKFCVQAVCVLPPLPQAQLHLAKLPEELQERCISPALSWERSQARLVQPLAVPRSAEGWERMNRQLARVLPPRYLR